MKNIYTDISNVLTYNAILNFIIGERGVGKSYSSKKYVINHFLKTNKKFVYLRRYKTELKESVPKFFDDIILNKEFKGGQNVKYDISSGAVTYEDTDLISQDIRNFVNNKIEEMK